MQWLLVLFLLGLIQPGGKIMLLLLRQWYFCAGVSLSVVRRSLHLFLPRLLCGVLILLSYLPLQRSSHA